ncbi:MAG: PEGA domain-containing protein [Myxococcales bacterium]|nr:PEGA domain-containing protein [Myxococcales bacterium]
MHVKGVIVFVSITATVAMAAPKTLVVGAGDCQSVELVTGLNDFSGALREKLKSDLYEPDVVLDIVRPRPTRSLEDVERQVESARTLFYNGQHDRALDLLKQALAELERAPLAGQPWKVTAPALALQGVVLTSLNKKGDAAEAFRRVLRVEPAHTLSSDEFTPSVISQFELFRKELARQKKGVTQVQSTPPGAEVLVEGRVMGVTPLKLELPPSTYRVAVRANDRVSYLRVIAVPRDALIQVDLASEGALATQAPLCLAAKDKLAEAAALKLANTVTADDLIVVRLEGSKGAPGQFVASRYEIRSGSMVREGRVQAPTRGKPAFGSLATFLLTGQGSSLIVSAEAGATVAAKPGELPVVASKPPPPPVVEPATSPALVEAPPSREGTISAGRVASFALMGAGVASAAGGLVAWVTGGADRSRLASLRQANGKLPEPTEPGHRESLDIIARADLNQTVTFSLLGAGAGLAAAGLISFFVFPSETVALTAVPSSTGAGVFVSGTF